MKDTTTKVMVGLIILLTMTTLLGLRKQNFSVPVSEKANSSRTGNDIDNLKQLFYDRYTALIVSTDGEKIDPAILLSDTSLKTHPLSELTKSRSVLIFRYSYKDCDMCVSAVIRILEKQFTGADRKKVIVITDAYNERDFIIKARYAKSQFPLYCSPPAGFKLPAENRNLPFLFILGSDHKVTKLFVPFKEFPDQIEEYLSYCKEYLNITKP